MTSKNELQLLKYYPISSQYLNFFKWLKDFFFHFVQINPATDGTMLSFLNLKVLLPAFLFPCNLFVNNLILLSYRLSHNPHFDDGVIFGVPLSPLFSVKSQIGLEACSNSDLIFGQNSQFIRGRMYLHQEAICI